MDRDAFSETIQRLKRQKPFRPFTVVLDNGDRIKVDYSDALAVRVPALAFLGPGSKLHIFTLENVREILGDPFGRGTEA